MYYPVPLEPPETKTVSEIFKFCFGGFKPIGLCTFREPLWEFHRVATRGTSTLQCTFQWPLPPPPLTTKSWLFLERGENLPAPVKSLTA